MVTGHVSITKLLSAMGKVGASDLHIKVGLPPVYRIGGNLKPIQSEPLTADEADHLLDPIVPEGLRPKFEAQGDLDFATYGAEGDRFRVNMFRAGGHVNAAIRRVKADIPTYQKLHLPSVYNDLVERTREGLILIVGVTGSGKSTTLAAMLEHINATRSENIITIEDPVEYRIVPKLSIVSQREIGIDVPSYQSALRFVVRQDPDVIFIGELRDHDTVLAAIQASETGHLVFGSMHTADTSQAFSRILEFFPSHEHAFIRSAMASSLKAICAQRLLPAVDGFEVSTVPATEVLLNTPIVQQLIREGRDSDLPSVLGSSVSEGMRSFTYSLAELVRHDWVAQRIAVEYAPNRDALLSELRGMQIKAQGLVGRVRG